MNKKNLLKLADPIEGCDPDFFNISEWRSGGHEPLGLIEAVQAENALQKKKKKSNDDKFHYCDSVGCIIGWAPFMGIPEFEVENSDYTWEGYSERIFELDRNSDEWDWCFSPYWKYVDNTPEGAAARIRYLVKVGLPDNWQEQMNGNADLCYRPDRPNELLW